MKNRYIPFGYRLLNGVITPHEVEAEMVRLAFRKYIAGESYGRIAGLLEKMGCPYSEDSIGWNKNMVGRILQNRRYTGRVGYPSLVSEDEFTQALLLQRGKYTRKDIHTSPEVTILKGKVVCAQCGSTYERILDSRKGEKWRCRNPECQTLLKITDALLIEQVAAMLNSAVNDPSVIETTPVELQFHDLEVTRLTNEINRELDKTDCDEEYVKRLIPARAAAQYASCSGSLLPQKTQKLKAAFENSTPTGQLDIGLFNSTVNTVLLQPDGTASLELKNGQSLDNNIQERSMMLC